MKLNLGCGHRQLPGYVNVDAWAGCNPDQVVDLEATPWPWPDSSAEEVLFIHSLEHMGERSATFLAIVKELYRVCAPGCQIRIHVPHPRHDSFIGDPTHVRPITPGILRMFDKSACDEWVAKGAANTPLAHHLGVDFRITESQTVLTERYAKLLQQGELDDAAIRQLLDERLNVASEFRITLTVHKPVEA